MGLTLMGLTKCFRITLHIALYIGFFIFIFRPKVFMSFYTTVLLNINWDGRKEVSQKWKLLGS